MDFKKEEEIWVKSPYLDQKLPQHEIPSNEKRAPKHTFPRLIAEALFKVPFIYYVSTFIAQNLICLPNFKFFIETFFFRQIKRISFPTLHFDEIVMLEFEFLIT